MPVTNPSLRSFIGNYAGQMGEAAKVAGGISPQQTAAAPPNMTGVPMPQQTTLPTQSEMLAGGAGGMVPGGGGDMTQTPEFAQFAQLIQAAPPDQVAYILSLIQDPEMKQDAIEMAMQLNPGFAQLMAASEGQPGMGPGPAPAPGGGMGPTMPGPPAPPGAQPMTMSGMMA